MSSLGQLTGKKRRPPLRIAGKRIGRGKVYDFELPYSETYIGGGVGVPVRVIAAPRPGPVIFLMGVVHGDELNGLGIIREIAFERPLDLVRGTIIALPVVNIPGLENHSRYLSDRRDLNRCFPGAAKGSLSGRLARLIWDEIVTKCDYGIDFHTAAVRRTNYPNVRADFGSQGALELGRAFGCHLLVHSSGAVGSLRRTATAADIPTIVLEAGEVWKIEPGIMELGVQGTYNVLAHLRMIRQKPAANLIEEIRRTIWIRAESGGILKFHVAPGQAVRKGQILATNLGIFGQHQNQISAPAAGFILGMTTMPAVKPGEAVFHLAIPSRSTARKIRSQGTNLEVSPEAADIQRILATNVLLQKTRRRKNSVGTT